MMLDDVAGRSVSQSVSSIIILGDDGEGSLSG